jgi:predicted nucleic acid-binding protein
MSKETAANIFIDTNIIRDDTRFFKVSFINTLTFIADFVDVHLYVSEIVRLEHKEDFKRQAKTAIKKAEEYLHFLKTDESITRRTTDAAIEEYHDTAFQELLEKHQITLIPYSNLSNEDFQKMILNAVRRNPPFEEQDKGFRDCCILRSYINFIKENKLERQNNFLLSADHIFKASFLENELKEVNLISITSVEKCFSQEPKLNESIKKIIKSAQDINFEDMNDLFAIKAQENINNYLDKTSQCLQQMDPFAKHQEWKCFFSNGKVASFIASMVFDGFGLEEHPIYDGRGEIQDVETGDFECTTESTFLVTIDIDKYIKESSIKESIIINDCVSSRILTNRI